MAGCADPGVSVFACSRPPPSPRLVSLITFGVLLDGLQSQNASVVKARAANDSVTQAGVLERIALDVARGDEQAPRRAAGGPAQAARASSRRPLPRARRRRSTVS